MRALQFKQVTRKAMGGVNFFIMTSAEGKRRNERTTGENKNREHGRGKIERKLQT